jgi:hypothetical protein
MAGFPAPHPSMQVHSASEDAAAVATASSGFTAWRVIMMLGWVGGIVGYSTVWVVSRQIGLPTWWLGPRSQPTAFYVVGLPFLLPVLMLLAISVNLRRVALYGVVAALATGLIALGDAQSQPGLAMIQAAISLGLLCTSLAALIGHREPAGANKRKAAPAR